MSTMSDGYRRAESLIRDSLTSPMQVTALAAQPLRLRMYENYFSLLAGLAEGVRSIASAEGKSPLRDVRVELRPDPGVTVSIRQHCKGHVILFDDSFVHFLSMFDTLFVSTLSLDDTSQEGLSRLFTSSAQQLFDHLLYWRTDGAHGTFEAATPARVAHGDDTIARSLLETQILFLLLHEFAHVTLGHLFDVALAIPAGDGTNSKVYHAEQAQELEADARALTALVVLCRDSDELTYVLNAALPVLFAATSFVDLVSALMFRRSAELMDMHTEHRFFRTHPDSDRRLAHAHIVLLDSTAHEMIADLPEGRPEWHETEYRRMWNHGIMFGVNNSKALIEGLVNVRGQIPMPIGVPPDARELAELRARFKPIY